MGYQFSSKECLYKARSGGIGCFHRERSNQGFYNEAFLRRISLISVSSTSFHPGDLASIAASIVKRDTREYTLGTPIILIARGDTQENGRVQEWAQTGQS